MTGRWLESRDCRRTIPLGAYAAAPPNTTLKGVAIGELKAAGRPVAFLSRKGFALRTPADAFEQWLPSVWYPTIQSHDRYRGPGLSGLIRR
jgi:hypothetical protein